MGAIGLCVPPSMTTSEGASASSSGHITVCRTKVVLPAVPMAMVCRPGATVLGANHSSMLPTASPRRLAPLMVPAARTAARC